MLAGFMSAFMVLMLLGLVARRFIRNMKDPPGGEWRLVCTHVDAYFLSLLGAETLQGLGAIMSVKWVYEGVLYCSDYCTAQGALKTIGATGVAMSTLVSNGDSIVLDSISISYCAVLTGDLPGDRRPHLHCHILLVDTRATISLDLSNCHRLDMELPYIICRHRLL